ncbi:MAG: hypothetical protein WC852_07245 [Candidatus Nanoarchaeia archaeon]|jgi:hypothetical protein
MNKQILILILGVIILVFSGCTQKVICNKPYIQMGSECCLDQDGNNICDKDEIRTSTPEPSEPTIVTTEPYNPIITQPSREISIIPSELEFHITNEKNYDSSTFKITNIGDASSTFYIWAPNNNDGTGRVAGQSSCSWSNGDSYFILNHGETREISLTCGVYSEITQNQYVTESGYVYASKSSECGSMSTPLNHASCPQNALFKKAISLKFDITAT